MTTAIVGLKTPLKKLERVRQWRLNNLERARAIAKKSRDKHAERCRARAREWHAKNRDRHNAYCADRRKNNPRAVVSAKLKSAFGITLEQYEELSLSQNESCAICGTPQIEQRKKMAVDHDHATGKVRALLCHNYNVGIGNFKDNPQILTKAINS